MHSLGGELEMNCNALLKLKPLLLETTTAIISITFIIYYYESFLKEIIPDLDYELQNLSLQR